MSTDEERERRRAETMRALGADPTEAAKALPIHSVHIEGVELWGPCGPDRGPQVTMVINKGTPTEVRFGREELSDSLLIGVLVFEAREALVLRAIRALDTQLAVSDRCPTCGIGPPWGVGRDRLPPPGGRVL